MKKKLGLVALIGASAFLLTGCVEPMPVSEVESKTPAVIFYPQESSSGDREWAFVNDDHEIEPLTCEKDGFFASKKCTNEAGTILWEPRKHKSTRYGYLTVDGGERERFRCKQSFENAFGDYDPSHFCYKRGS
jgi:hypothetical protein